MIFFIFTFETYSLYLVEVAELKYRNVVNLPWNLILKIIAHLGFVSRI